MDRCGYEEAINTASLDSLLMERLTNWLNLSVNCLGPPSASPSLLNWLLFCYYQFSRAEPSASSNRWVCGRRACLPTSVFRSAWIYLAFVTLGGADHVYSIVINAFDMLYQRRRPDSPRNKNRMGGRREEEGVAGGWKGRASFISSATVHEPCWLQYYFNSSSHLPYYLLIYAHHYGGCSLCDE